MDDNAPPKNPFYRPAAIEEKTWIADGEVTLTWHKDICSADDVADFEYWLNGILRRAKRRVIAADAIEAGEHRAKEGGDG